MLGGAIKRCNPDKNARGLHTKVSAYRFPFIGLAHEFGHAEAYDDEARSFLKTVTSCYLGHSTMGD